MPSKTQCGWWRRPSPPSDAGRERRPGGAQAVNGDGVELASSAAALMRCCHPQIGSVPSLRRTPASVSAPLTRRDLSHQPPAATLGSPHTTADPPPAQMQHQPAMQDAHRADQRQRARGHQHSTHAQTPISAHAAPAATPDQSAVGARSNSKTAQLH